MAKDHIDDYLEQAKTSVNVLQYSLNGIWQALGDKSNHALLDKVRYIVDSMDAVLALKERIIKFEEFKEGVKS